MQIKLDLKMWLPFFFFFFFFFENSRYYGYVPGSCMP